MSMDYREKLAALGLSQAEFARLLGIGKVGVNRWFTERTDSNPFPAYAKLVIDLLNDLAPRQRAKYIKAKRPPGQGKRA